MNDLENNILQELLKAPRTWRDFLDLFPKYSLDDLNFVLERLELKGFVRYGNDGGYRAVVNEIRLLD